MASAQRMRSMLTPTLRPIRSAEVAASAMARGPLQTISTGTGV